MEQPLRQKVSRVNTLIDIRTTNSNGSFAWCASDCNLFITNSRLYENYHHCCNRTMWTLRSTNCNMDFHVISVVINPSPDITREAKGQGLITKISHENSYYNDFMTYFNFMWYQNWYHIKIYVISDFMWYQIWYHIKFYVISDFYVISVYIPHL